MILRRQKVLHIAKWIHEHETKTVTVKSSFKLILRSFTSHWQICEITAMTLLFVLLMFNSTFRATRLYCAIGWLVGV